MEPLGTVRLKNYNDKANLYISPGPVSVVGDVLVQSYLRNSSADMPRRNKYSKTTLAGRGANVQDGTWQSYTTGGVGAETIVNDYSSRPYVKLQSGFRYQDLRQGAVTSSERLISQPQHLWKIQTAKIHNSEKTADLFPSRGGLIYEGVPRGPAPSITVISGADRNIIQGPGGFIMGRPTPSSSTMPLSQPLSAQASIGAVQTAAQNPIVTEPPAPPTPVSACPTNNCGGTNIESAPSLYEQITGTIGSLNSVVNTATGLYDTLTGFF